MNKIAIFFLLLAGALHSESAYPVDLSFLVADIKYSEEHGIKVCEVQQGVVSSFKGDVFAHNGVPVIANNLINTFALYVTEGWTVSRCHCDSTLKKLFADQENWHAFKKRQDIYNDPDFLSVAELMPADPENIHDYHGFVYEKCISKAKGDKLHEDYPGIVFVDRAVIPYWIDKAKVSALFEMDPVLQEIKPRWSTYPTHYTSSLAKKIKDELQTEKFVIKPKGAFLGRGVIIVSADELDSVLKYILNKTKELKKDPDNSYNYWYHTKDSEFIVEQFFSSDLVRVPHLENKLFQPTMRVSFLFAYSEQEIAVHFLGAYWLLPKVSIEDVGSLNDKHKGYCVLPHYAAVDPELEERVAAEIEDPFKLLYQKMLENR